MQNIVNRFVLGYSGYVPTLEQVFSRQHKAVTTVTVVYGFDITRK